jgi:hypothetical protein
MKTLAPTYSISGSTVTLTGVNVPLSQILLIADATTGSVLYSIGGPAPTDYTQATNSQITLATAPGSSDKLTIYYDNGTNPTNAPSTVTLGGGSAAIGTVGVSSLPALPAGSNSIGSVVNNGGTVTLAAGSAAIGTVGVSSLPAISGTVTLGGGSASIGSINNTSAQFSKISISTGTFNRPADTAAYLANDVVSNSTGAGTVITFSNAIPVSQGDGYIVAVRATTNDKLFATALRLHIYKSSPDASVVLNDNAPMKLMLADYGNRVGYVDLSGWTSASSTSDSSVCFGSFPGSGSSLPLELASASTTLYGVLETRAAFTPASAQTFTFTLKTQLA